MGALLMPETISFDTGALDRLVPLHMTLDAEGKIVHLGPTLAKLFRDRDLIACDLLKVFTLRHPNVREGETDLDKFVGGTLRVEFGDTPKTSFKGSLVRLANGGFLLNLSFGIGVIQAVTEHGLTIADFPETELTIEMLYLAEAQSTVLSESRHLIRRLQGAKIAAEEKAFTDTLTGLRNRRAMDFALNRLLKIGEKFGLMHIDLDFFKGVNDTMGHAAGDYVLQHVARVLVSETRGEDTVARVGGDEFVIILKGLTNIPKLKLIGERIIEVLERPIRFNGVELNISASVGATVSSRYPEPQAEQMLKDADLALYGSKDAGRACFTAFSDQI